MHRLTAWSRKDQVNVLVVFVGNLFSSACRVRWARRTATVDRSNEIVRQPRAVLGSLTNHDLVCNIHDRLSDRHSCPVEVDIGPSQSKNLATAHPGGGGQDIRGSESMGTNPR